jgi:hypothetical protein
MSEAKLQQAILDLVRWLGLLAFHSTDSRRDTSAGFPDLVICGQGGVAFRELKAERGRLRPEQSDWITRLRQGGANVDVWRPADLLPAGGRIKAELIALTGRTS